MFEIDPVVALDESLDHPAGMNRGVVENQLPKGSPESAGEAGGEIQ